MAKTYSAVNSGTYNSPNFPFFKLHVELATFPMDLTSSQKLKLDKLLSVVNIRKMIRRWLHIVLSLVMRFASAPFVVCVAQKCRC